MPMVKQVGKGRQRTEAADYFRFLLRMPEEMARQVDALAKADFATMNGQILKMLRERLKEPDMRARLAEVYGEEEPVSRPARRASR